MYRRTAIAVTTCAASLSLAACAAGITTASPAVTSSHAASPASRTAEKPRPSPSPSPAPSPSDKVRVNAPIGSFPIPPGASVVINDSCPKQVSLILGQVPPSLAESFYATALPRAGYHIVDNMTFSGTGGMLAIDFTGHGYKGTAGAYADLSSAAASADPSMSGSLPASMSKNVVEIMMTSPGLPVTYVCPMG